MDRIEALEPLFWQKLSNCVPFLTISWTNSLNLIFLNVFKVVNWQKIG